jgi:hypothetical protein
MSIPLRTVRQIYSHNPQDEIWNYYINRFTNRYYVKNFLRDKGMKSNATTIANNARQAIDFYFAYRTISIFSKPILLLYSFEKLAYMLVLSSKGVQNIRHHGLSYGSGKILVREAGLFSHFHDCYSLDPMIYKNKLSFKLEDLLRYPIRENDLNGLILREDEDLLLVKTKTMNLKEL